MGIRGGLFPFQVDFCGTGVRRAPAGGGGVSETADQTSGEAGLPLVSQWPLSGGSLWELRLGKRWVSGPWSWRAPGLLSPPAQQCPDGG